jgi:hypothetical protein
MWAGKAPPGWGEATLRRVSTPDFGAPFRVDPAHAIVGNYCRMRRAIASFVLTVAAIFFLAGCAEKEAHVLVTPLPPEPQRLAPGK